MGMMASVSYISQITLNIQVGHELRNQEETSHWKPLETKCERSGALIYSAVESFYCSSLSLICGIECSEEYSLINFSDGWKFHQG